MVCRAERWRAKVQVVMSLISARSALAAHCRACLRSDLTTTHLFPQEHAEDANLFRATRRRTYTDGTMPLQFIPG
jgi:hypothetical protein